MRSRLEDVLQPTMDELDAIASRGGTARGVPLDRLDGVVREAIAASGDRIDGPATTKAWERALEADPYRGGLLVMGVGRATRLLRFLGDMDKEYEGTARLGQETDTLDAEGTVVRTARVEVDAAGENVRLRQPSLPAFIDWLVSDEGQRAIAGFTINGEPQPPQIDVMKLVMASKFAQ
jgi:hypothetical protein